MTVSSSPIVLDLEFQGLANRIAAGVIRTSAGVLLVDPGPSSCLARLEQGLAEHGIVPRDLHGLLVTHVHLDHVGAVGTLVRRHPNLKVYVHERGAPHLVDPTKLFASATRLYGEHMDRLWGEFVPVPAASLRVITDGEVLTIGDAEIDVAYTSGHASHHLCYRDRRSGIVYAGDTGGIRLGPSPFVLPPTPPPDIDVPAWQASLVRLRAWKPGGVFVTHYGLYLDADTHLDALARELDAWARLAGDILRGGGDDESRTRRFVDGARARIERQVTPAEAESYRASISLEDCWIGLARHLQRSPGAQA